MYSSIKSAKLGGLADFADAGGKGKGLRIVENVLMKYLSTPEAHILLVINHVLKFHIFLFQEHSDLK